MERTTLCLLAHGLTTRQIAERLSITEQTAETYAQRILTHLGMHRRQDAIRRICQLCLAEERIRTHESRHMV